jgi:alpha(1,3/1,4) fucosyltransferase
MKKASLVVSDYLQNNNIFDEKSKDNRDNIFSSFILLKEEFLHNNIELNTSDITSIKEADIVIYYNLPISLPLKSNIYKSYIILSESELIRPDNYVIKKHKYFNKIFTWNDKLVDNKKYFKLNYSHLFPNSINKDLSKKEKLCTLIAGNKSANHPLELYTKRIVAIRWFEINYPEDFDLYGTAWDKYRFTGPKIIRAFNRVPYLSQIFLKFTGQNYPLYKGMVDNKKETMEKYKFSICYENAKDIPGYITEKIFDTFFAGCVPIYWGANNITDYVPKECFVDKRDYKTYEELYKFIKNISDKEYMNYLDSIENYINSEKKYIFTDKFYAKQIVKQIKNKDIEC